MHRRVLMGVFYEDRLSAMEYAWYLLTSGEGMNPLAERIDGNWQVTALQVIH